MLPDWIHTTLSRSDWMTARDAHTEAVEDLLGHHLARRQRHEADPVSDFLFEYYGFRPAALATWSPGIGIALEDGQEALPEALRSVTEDGVAYLDPAHMPERHVPGTRFMLRVLEGTQSRPALFGCAGLHEWAMVYRSDAVRHADLPLRLPPSEIAAVVETGPLVCTHYDAFRFFTPEARPLNRTALSLDHLETTEQSGCLHTNMDLYRWAFKRYPWIPSALILDALRLAFAIREIDMRASPYDVSELGLDPIPVETREGRATYARYQQTFQTEAAPLRDALISAYRALLGIRDGSRCMST